jgi:hypothetical protein
MLSGLLLLGGCNRRQEFSFQPRPGLTMRYVLKGVTRTNYDGQPAALLNFDLHFDKQAGAPVYFLFDSLRVACNNAVSIKTSCRTASLNVVSQREEIPAGTCLFSLYAVFPDTACLKPVTAFDVLFAALYDEQYERIIRRQRGVTDSTKN